MVGQWLLAFFVNFGHLDSSNFAILHSDISFWISRCEQQAINLWSVKSEMFTPQRLRANWWCKWPDQSLLWWNFLFKVKLYRVHVGNNNFSFFLRAFLSLAWKGSVNFWRTLLKLSSFAATTSLIVVRVYINLPCKNKTDCLGHLV